MSELLKDTNQRDALFYRFDEWSVRLLTNVSEKLTIHDINLSKDAMEQSVYFIQSVLPYVDILGSRMVQAIVEISPDLDDDAIGLFLKHRSADSLFQAYQDFQRYGYGVLTDKAFIGSLLVNAYRPILKKAAPMIFTDQNAAEKARTFAFLRLFYQSLEFTEEESEVFRNTSLFPDFCLIPMQNKPDRFHVVIYTLEPDKFISKIK